MKKYYYRKQSFKLFGFITLFSLTLIMSSCGTGKDEKIEIPNETPKESPEETTKKDVVETVAAATQVAEKYFSECNSISELEKHLDEIRKTEGVKNAYIDSQTLYVEYDKIGKIIYHYPIYPSREEHLQTRIFERSDFSLTDAPSNQKTRSSDTNEPNKNVHYKLNKSDKHSLVIYNALYADANFESDHIRFEQLKELYNNISCNVKLIEDTNYSCYDFFYNDIFQYDMVILNGHGGFDSSTGNHWFITGNRFKYSDIDDVQSLKGYTIEEIKYIIESHQNESQYNGAGIAALHEDYILNGKRYTSSL